ncbi:hypothetical protein EDC02_3836 [Micromonospora sp. Llam0]|uniref:hypothetical protein n=1 Tax=Micromonospora sp. Llam0 TaxID=2485143 RepID=UPI000F48B0C7|nr:hypothetical protein [Micromonospora sp. Llam0]ROO61876.1 hypothetical protein EDC02_3836 [Micromonospora sp. Llam0]
MARSGPHTVVRAAGRTVDALLARIASGLRRGTDVTASAFVRVEVRHPDGRLAALSNPVTLVRSTRGVRSGVICSDADRGTPCAGG